MTLHDDAALAGWLAEGPERGPVEGLETALTKVRSTRQRPAWLVALAGDTIAERPTVVLLRYGVYAVGAVLLAGALVGVLIAGGVLPPKPVTPPPAPQASMTTAPDASSTPEPTASASLKSAVRLVAYYIVDCPVGAHSGPLGSACTRAGWLATTDGSGARQLPGEPVGWSADGSRLLVLADSGPILLDAGGSTVRAFPGHCTDKLPSPQASCAAEPNVLCTYPCSGTDGFALSPDGARAAFVRSSADVQNATVVAVLDLASGRVTELASTRTTNPSDLSQCNKVRTCQGIDDTPRWSPDGRRIAFARQTMSPDSPEATWNSAALFVVDANGGNLRRLTPTGLAAIDPSWSADGTRLVFTNSRFVVNAARTSVVAIPSDIYTIDLDGSHLTRLTTDGISARPDWTSGGRIAFMRQLGPPATLAGNAQGYMNWIMDADGSHQSRPGASLTALTAAGCTTCVYPLSGGAGSTEVDRAYWQPTP